MSGQASREKAMNSMAVSYRNIERGRKIFDDTGRRQRENNEHEDTESKLPRLLTVQQVARVLQKTPKAVRRMIDRNQLPVSRMGRCIRIRRDPLLKGLKIQEG